METTIYLLSARYDVDYDCYSHFVIEAENEQRAREIAQEHGGVETMGPDWKRHGLQFWTDDYQTSCEELKPIGEEGIRCESFHAG